MTPLGDVYEKSAGAWVKRANIAGPAQPVYTPKSVYARPASAGGGVAAGAGDWIGATFLNASGRPILWTMQGTVTVPVNASLRAWLVVNGVEVPGRLWYTSGDGGTHTFSGSKWQPAPPVGDLAVVVKYNCAQAWTMYNDATTLGDANVTFLLGQEF